MNECDFVKIDLPWQIMSAYSAIYRTKITAIYSEMCPRQNNLPSDGWAIMEWRCQALWGRRVRDQPGTASRMILSQTAK